MEILTPYLFAYLGLIAYLLIDGGALNRSTPKITTIATINSYFCLNVKYILLCAILLFVVVYAKGNLPLLPDRFHIEGTGMEVMAFMWGLGIQWVTIQIRKYVNPTESGTTPIKPTETPA